MRNLLGYIWKFKWRLWTRGSGSVRFPFFDGRQWQEADPLEVLESLASDPTYLPRHLAEARFGDQQSLKICCDVSRKAFGLLPLDQAGHGLSFADQFELLLRFEFWMEKLEDEVGRATPTATVNQEHQVAV